MGIGKYAQGKLNHTYNIGMHFIVNAIPDVCLYLDGANCNYERVMSLEQAHDIYAELMQRDGCHRIFSGGKSEDRYIHSRIKNVVNHLEMILENDRFSGVLVLPMALSMVTSVDYDNIFFKIKNPKNKHLIYIPSNTYELDWIDAYDEGMLCLAKKLDPKPSRLDSNKIVVVGHLFDRWEGDNLGNIRELERIATALGLQVETLWLDGRKLSEYKKDISASLIVSLPYGRKTAKWLSKKCGLKLVEVDLPVGLSGTSDFINKIAEATGREKEAGLFIKSELEKTIHKVDKIIPKYIQEKVFMLTGEKHIVTALASGMEEIGGRIGKTVLLNYKSEDAFKPEQAIWEPCYSDIYEMDMSNIDYVIGNGQIKNILDYRDDQMSWKYVGFGYPSEYYHCLTDEPYFGYLGWLNFLKRIVNAT